MRKNRLTYLLLLMIMVACKPTVPSEYIQPDDMEDILYDYHVAQAMAKQLSFKDANIDRTRYFLSVLEKHEVTEADFDSSLVYYYSHVDRLQDIYKEVNRRLSDESTNLGVTVGDINRYSQYSATGDTANIWNQHSDLLLIPCPTMNRYDFTVEVDTTFHLGDSFMFQFVAEYLWQSGSKDATVCIVTKYEGDSIIQTTNHVSASGTAQIRVPANHLNKLKEMKGFIYLNAGNDDSNTRKMMFISQIQLIRFHDKVSQYETAATETPKADSLQRGDDDRRPMPDTLRSRTVGGRHSIKPLPVNAGNSIHRMDAGPPRLKD